MVLLSFIAGWAVMTAVSMPNPETARQTFDLINQERQSADLVPLIWDNELEILALRHSQYMSDTNDFRHSAYPFAENIAQGGTGSARELYRLWYGSYLHHQNYMDASFRYAAIGITYKITKINFGNMSIPIMARNGYATFIAK